MWSRDHSICHDFIESCVIHMLVSQYLCYKWTILYLKYLLLFLCEYMYLALCERYFKANTHNKVVNFYLIFEKIQSKSMEQVQIKVFWWWIWWCVETSSFVSRNTTFNNPNQFPFPSGGYMNPYITNLLGFMSLYKFCVKSSFHRFIQKSYELHVMVNMNKFCKYSIS
jgi:hypothetical protein